MNLLLFKNYYFDKVFKDQDYIKPKTPLIFLVTQYVAKNYLIIILYMCRLISGVFGKDPNQNLISIYYQTRKRICWFY